MRRFWVLFALMVVPVSERSIVTSAIASGSRRLMTRYCTVMVG